MDPILVVEDHPDVRDAVVAILEQLGVESVVADNGDSALEILRDGRRPCAILLDLMMPGTDGWEFRQRQLRDPQLASIPVVVMTARPDVADIERRLGIAVLPKPVRYEQLQALVEQYCAAGV